MLLVLLLLRLQLTQRQYNLDNPLRNKRTSLEFHLNYHHCITILNRHTQVVLTLFYMLLI